MINGKGGRLGPDLSRIAVSRSRAYIVESIRQPEQDPGNFHDAGDAATKRQ